VKNTRDELFANARLFTTLHVSCLLAPFMINYLRIVSYSLLFAFYTYKIETKSHYRNPALCRVLGALPSVFCRSLGKVTLLVTTPFTECRTLGIDRHSIKTSLPSATRSANGDARQRAISSRL
jgi:Na+-translocating ferredoxin:NAD+ oxidoreductase RnfA subunit